MSLSFSHNWLLILFCSSVTIKKNEKNLFCATAVAITVTFCGAPCTTPSPLAERERRAAGSEPPCPALRGERQPAPVLQRGCPGSAGRAGTQRLQPRRARSGRAAARRGPSARHTRGRPRRTPGRGRGPARTEPRAPPRQARSPCGERRSPIARAPSASPPRRPRVPGPYRPLGSLGARRGCRGLSGTAASHRPILPAPRSRHRRATRPAPGT